MKIKAQSRYLLLLLLLIIAVSLILITFKLYNPEITGMSVAEPKESLVVQATSNTLQNDTIEEEIEEANDSGEVSVEVISLKDPINNPVEVIRKRENKTVYDTFEVIRENKGIKQASLIHSIPSSCAAIDEDADNIIRLYSSDLDDLEELKNYLKANNIEVLILYSIDDLAESGTTLRRSLGLSMMVKFDWGARSQTRSLAVESLPFEC